MFSSLTLLVLLNTPTTAPASTYGDAVYQFGAKFLTAVSKTDKENAIVSPSSGHMALGMLANGLKNKTADQVQVLIGNKTDLVNQWAKAYIDQASWSDGITIANGIWAVNGTKLNDAYMATIGTNYQAGCGAVESKNGADIINQWVKDNTKDRIKDLFKPFNDQTVLALVSALTFDAKWQYPFEVGRTTTDVFKSPKGDVKVPMMHQTHAFLCCEWGQRKVLEMRYQGGYKMLVLLPAEGESVNKMLADLTPDRWSNLGSILSDRQVVVSFPKFKAETAIDLHEPFRKMGAPNLFVSSTDFAGLLAKPDSLMCVGQAIQKVFIDVDEVGTKAGAATGMSVEKRGASGGPMIFNANRPFLFAILDNKNRVPIIMGIINDPTK